MKNLLFLSLLGIFFACSPIPEVDGTTPPKSDMSSPVIDMSVDSAPADPCSMLPASAVCYWQLSSTHPVSSAIELDAASMMPSICEYNSTTGVITSKSTAANCTVVFKALEQKRVIFDSTKPTYLSMQYRIPSGMNLSLQIKLQNLVTAEVLNATGTSNLLQVYQPASLSAYPNFVVKANSGTSEANLSFDWIRIWQN